MAKVLIVDDSPAHVLALKQLVEQWGHVALTAPDGDKAIAAARQEQPDVILMDVVMPGMNGFQTARKLTRSESTKTIPIIFVSIRSEEADRVWGMRQGAIAYITKPVNPETLCDAIADAVAA